MAPKRTSTVWTSALRANWPFFHASSSRLGVACSVFSPRCSAMGASVHSHQLSHANDVLRQAPDVIGDVFAHQLAGQTEDAETRQQTDGKVLEEDIHLRHGAAEHGEDQRDDEADG